MSDDIDQEAFRKFEHDGWNSLSDGYHDHWEHLTPQIIPLMLERTGVGADSQVLDIASGPGYAAGAAAALGATATGIDLSENMRDLAATNFPDVSFQLGDAEDLPFDTGSFDVVTMNFGVLHFPDADKALGEAFRVLQSGGRLGFTAWEGPDGSALGMATDAIVQEGTVKVDLPQGTPIFRFAEHAECARVLDAIGFMDISSTDTMLTWNLPRPDALMESFRQATARMSALLGAQDPAKLPAISAAMTAACKPYDNGTTTDLPMPAVLTVGTKP
jgi:ubiquinone/menaquinone biosynthesis C-methylase UbiE